MALSFQQKCAIELGRRWERNMKRMLDGSFRHIESYGLDQQRYITRSVPSDWFPDYAGKPFAAVQDKWYGEKHDKRSPTIPEPTTEAAPAPYFPQAIHSEIILGLENVEPEEPSAKDIVRAAARAAGVDVQTLTGPRRLSHLVKFRQAAAHVLKVRKGHLSYPQIGWLIGRKDHSTAMHAVKVVEERPKYFQFYIAAIEAELARGGS